MAYIINRFNGEQLAIVDDGVLDTTTSIGLLGRNYTGYGEVQNENLVFLLENFAGVSPPSRAISGQVWYDSTGKALKVFNGTGWLSIGNATVADNEPDHSVGGLWLKTATQQMFVSDGTTWRLVGPEGVEGFSVTKHTSSSLVGTDGTTRPVILTQIDGETTSIYSAVDFTISEAASIPGFSILKKGINLKSTHSLTGNVTGNSDTATSLKTARAINNVNFDGTSNITIKASTVNPLKVGNYITGSDWDGTVEDTWGVNATPENQIGTVVSRDSSGGFAAGPISAELIGNVTGNVTAYQGTSTFVRVVAPTIVGNTFTGNSNSADRLAVPRTINTVLFDGTQDIEIPVPADTLTGTTLAPNVVTSSLTRLGKLVSLGVEGPGITVGDGNNLNIYLEGFTPTIESDTTNVIKLKLASGSTTTGATGISFISAATSQSNGGISAPALVPDFNEGTDITQRASLGLPTSKWGRIYTENAYVENIFSTTISGSNSGSVVFPTGINATGGLSGNLVGNTAGTHSGNVIGSVTGASSLNVLKSGDVMSGDITWSGTGRGLTWGMNTDGASIRFYNTGDADTNSRLEFNTNDNGNEYFRWTHTVGGNTFESMRLTPNSFGSADLTLTGNANINGNVTLLSTNNTFQGRGSGITDLNAANLTTGTVPIGRLSGTYNIGISGNANTATTAGSATSNLYRTGDTLTGRLGQSVNGFHASSIENISIRTNSGFYDSSTPTVAEGWPVNGSWHHLLSSTHTNDANYYAMQFSGDFYDSNNVYYRATAGNGSAAWHKLLHSGNYTTVTVGKDGTGATGLWGININGNANTVNNGVYTTSSYSNPNWITGLAGSKISGAVALASSVSGGSVSATTGSFSGQLSISSSGIKFPNDAYGGGLDTATITLETKGGEATTMAFRMTNDVDDTIGFFAPSDNGLTMNNNVVIHAANYTNYAPTKTGSGASGTWPISINGNALTVSSITRQHVLDALGYTPVNPTSLNNRAGTALSGTTGSFSDAIFTSAGSTKGIRFPTDAFGGSGDSATITLETKGGEGTSLTFRVANDADDTINFYAPADAGVKINDNTVLHAANYYFYAPSLTGGNASGTWPISIDGNAVTVSSITRQQVINALGYTPTDGTTFPSYLLNQGNVTAESNGTGEPGNKLTLRSVYNNGYPTQYGNVITLGGAGGGELLVGWSGTTGAHADNYIRSRRDTGNTWSPWAKVVTDQNISALAGSLGLGFRVTYGTVSMASWHSHVGWFHWEYIYGDVFPPAGKTMASLLGVIVSNKYTYFGGSVNGDDILGCFAEVLGDRIRVHVGNSEQRAGGEANWLAIWGN